MRIARCTTLMLAPRGPATRASRPVPAIPAALRLREPATLPPHVVHAIAVLRGVGRVVTRPLLEQEARALGVVYGAYDRMLLSTARPMVGSADAAADVVHDVVCRLPWAIALYRDGSFGGWLRQVTVRAALRRLRAARVRGEAVALDGHESAWDTATPADFAALEDGSDVERALHALAEPLRQVLVLRLRLEMTHAEIAEALGISLGASEVRLCRALEQLRAVLRGATRGHTA